jgi:NAD(P) transhydrogenase subunit beta
MGFGGGIGLFIAKKIDMTALPQLVAAFHSLVGLAAVFVACAIFASPGIFGIAGTSGGNMPVSNAIEMSVGAAIGAVTCTGSVVAFGKLQGFISGKPLRYKGQHKINLLIAIAVAVAIAAFVVRQTPWALAAVIALSLLIGYLLITLF